jgi:hypothetical protein
VPSYRLWPQQTIGAGGFTALLRNADDGPAPRARWEALRPVWLSR